MGPQGQISLSAPVGEVLYCLTACISVPQGHLPGFWLMVSQAHLGPQLQTNLATVLKVLGFSQPSAFSITLPFSTAVTLP